MSLIQKLQQIVIGMSRLEASILCVFFALVALASPQGIYFEEKMEASERKLQNEIENMKERIAYLEEVITNISAKLGGLDYNNQSASHKLGRLKCWGSEDRFQDVETTISILQDSMEDVLKRSIFCSFQRSWTTDNSVITFKKLLINDNNINSSMNINTGKFTAGVSGIYNMAVSLTFEAGYWSGKYSVYLRINNSDVTESVIYSEPSFNSYKKDKRWTQMMRQLSAGDQVSLYAADIYSLKTITFCINLMK